jgi:hypothetical protein
MVECSECRKKSRKTFFYKEPADPKDEGFVLRGEAGNYEQQPNDNAPAPWKPAGEGVVRCGSCLTNGNDTTYSLETGQQV